MRFSTYRATYRVATQHFGSTAAYRRLYQAPVQLAAVFPYSLTRTNPVTLRSEASGSIQSSSFSSLFATAMKTSSLTSPAGDLSAIEEYKCMMKLMHHLGCTCTSGAIDRRLIRNDSSYSLCTKSVPRAL